MKKPHGERHSRSRLAGRAMRRTPRRKPACVINWNDLILITDIAHVVQDGRPFFFLSFFFCFFVVAPIIKSAARGLQVPADGRLTGAAISPANWKLIPVEREQKREGKGSAPAQTLRA